MLCIFLLHDLRENEKVLIAIVAVIRDDRALRRGCCSCTS